MGGRRMRRTIAAGVAVAAGMASALATGPAYAGLFPNTPPTAVATATPNPAHAGDTVHLYGTGSSDSETPANQLLYAWDFGDGETTSASATNFAVDHVYAAGVYTATLTVTDPEGKSDVDQVVINVDDTAPTAKATATPATVQVNHDVQFDASGSSDAETPDAELVFTWDFADGTTGAGIAPTHSYAAAGTYVVGLTVKDPQGATATTTITVTVTNTAPTSSWTMTPSSPHTGQVVTLDGSESTDTETPATLSYDWDFGDGSAHATTKVATHTYATNGFKTVKLKVTDPQGLTDSRSVLVNVGSNRAPVAVATATRTKANVGQTVGFNGSSSTDAETPAAQLGYSWDFGNGGSTEDATGITTSYAFPAPGTYTVTLTVSDPDNHSATDTVTITVGNQAPVANPVATPSTAHQLESVAFDGSTSTDAETPDQLSYSWIYGDGTPATSYSSNPKSSHVYTAIGTYTVTLRVKDAEGSIGTKAITVKVLANGSPVAVASATPNPAHVGKQVSFSSTGSSDPDGGALTYHWAFPGGATADTASAQHTFGAVGSYQATLTVTDQYGITDTDTITVTVTNTAPVAKADATPNPVHVGSSVSFTSADTSDPDGDTIASYHWAFPGGATADTASAQHTFGTVGSYDVTLTVTDQYGDTDTDTITVTVTNTAPVAKADATPNPVHVGSSVSFTSADTSDPDGDTIASYHWAFPGGSVANTASTQHTFGAVGSYQVTLTVTDQYGVTDTDTITVTVTNSAPVAKANATPNPVHVGSSVSFTSTGTSDPDNDAIASYHWAFPGGATSNTATAQHTFGAVGSYQVTLTVTDQYGVTDTDTITVTVANSAPVAKANATPNPVHVGELVSFTSTGTGDPENDAIASYHWDFDGEGTASTASAQHTFGAVGSYDVTLTVTDQYGVTDTDTISVSVTNSKPVPNATVTPNPVHVGSQVTIDAGSSSDPDGDALTYLWSYAGSTSTNPVLALTFNTHGDKVLTLTVTDSHGASASKAVTVTVVDDAPVAAFTSTSGVIYAGSSVAFDARSSKDVESPDGLSYSWNFGDGTTGTGPTIKHGFGAGNFPVTLTVTDPQGKKSSVTHTVSAVRALPCQSSTATRTKQWRVVRSTSSQGGSYCDNLRGTTRGGTVRLTAPGPRFGVTYGRSGVGGKAEIWIDGVKKTTVSFRGTSRPLAFGYTKWINGLSTGSHRIVIKMVRGSGYLDNLLVYR